MSDDCMLCNGAGEVEVVNHGVYGCPLCISSELNDELTALRSQVAELQAKLDEQGKQEPVGKMYQTLDGAFHNKQPRLLACRIVEVYRLPPNTEAMVQRAREEEREAALTVMRKAVIALAHAAESNPVYQDAYNELDAAIRARKG